MNKLTIAFLLGVIVALLPCGADNQRWFKDDIQKTEAQDPDEYILLTVIPDKSSNDGLCYHANIRAVRGGRVDIQDHTFGSGGQQFKWDRENGIRLSFSEPSTPETGQVLYSDCNGEMMIKRADGYVYSIDGDWRTFNDRR